MNKLKVLVVCHFSNVKVRRRLPLDDRKMYGYMRKILGLPGKSGVYVDLASWDTNLIDNLSKRADIELYVVSAHSGLKKTQVQFEMEGVRYWFLRCDFVTMCKHIVPSASLWHLLNPMRPKVHRIVRQVKPDVVALIGAENPHISGTVLGLENEFPIIVKTQTIYNNPLRRMVGHFDKKNGYVENLIFKRMKYFSVTAKTHCELFRKFNPTAYNFKWSLATTYPKVRTKEKMFDFVNFAMSMSVKKGYHDALRALAIVKQQFPGVTMNLVGGGTQDELNSVKKLVEDLDLHNNVVLTSLFPEQVDMFEHIQKARFALLPCKMDYVSSTIQQAMYYELPVICYKTEGTEQLNSDVEKVLIAENGNYEDLAAKMMVFLTEPNVVERLRKAAKAEADRKNDNRKLAEQIVTVFQAVTANFNDGVSVPEDLLYDKV